MSLRLPVLLSVLLLGALPAAARADFFGGDVVDPDGASIQKVSDVDIARDGSGAVAYTKQVDGVTHAFVARLVGGAWQPPERVDEGLSAPSSQPVVAVSDGGRVAVAFVSGGTLVTNVRPNAGQPYAGPAALATDASNPSIDMSINGGAYVSFTTGGDVRVARMDRLATSFVLLPSALDVYPTDVSGQGDGRSDVAVSADGTAVVVWGAGPQLWARRVFFDHLSDAPQPLNVPTLDGHAGGAASDPTIDLEDDSSFGWVVFREVFDDGVEHFVARRLVGSAFQNDTQVDALPFGNADGVTGGSDYVAGKGEGMAVSARTSNATVVSLLHDDEFFPPVGLGGPNGVAPHPVAMFDEINQGYVFWLSGTSPADARVHTSFFDVKPADRGVPAPGPDLGISDLGIDVDAGFDGGIDRAGDATVVFVGTNGSRRLLAAGFDRPPGVFATTTTSKYRKFARPPLNWSQSFELQGPIVYTVFVGDQQVGQTTARSLVPANPIPDGVHQWKVVATDRRGQVRTTIPRTLRVDATPPEASVKLSGTRRAGKPITVTTTAADGSLTAPAGSGVGVVRVAFGDGSSAAGRVVQHRYARGSYTVRVTVADKAGNVTVVRRPLTIAKAKAAKKRKK